MGKCPRKVRGNVFVFVLEPPTVEDLQPPFNTPFQERLANQRIAFPCPAKGMRHSGVQAWVTGHKFGIWLNFYLKFLKFHLPVLAI